jgi:hypothetical protein
LSVGARPFTEEAPKDKDEEELVHWLIGPLIHWSLPLIESMNQ